MKPARHLFICRHSRAKDHPRGSCGASGSTDVVQAFVRELGSRRMHNQVMVTRCECFGPCERGPNIIVYPEGVLYNGVTPGDVWEIFDSHLENGMPVERLMAPADLW